MSYKTFRFGGNQSNVTLKSSPNSLKCTLSHVSNKDLWNIDVYQYLGLFKVQERTKITKYLAPATQNF